VSLEDAFAKVVGRSASEEERARLYRLREALGLRDNDAFWSIVMALEYYDSFFRAYPAKFAQQAASTIERARAALETAAEREAAQVQRVLSEKVAETSVQIAKRKADRPIGFHQITLLLGTVVAFGALCVNAGYHLASTAATFWAAHASDLAGAPRAAGIILAVPAGWMIFALLLPAAGYGVKAGWELARDPLSAVSDKAIGWLLIALSVAGGVACAALLAKAI
jgi:hypothetical protein